MTLSLYSTYKAWKRDNAREVARQRQSAAPSPHPAMNHGASAYYAAFASMGCGLGGMACAEVMESCWI